jgi:acyl carrier protein
MYRTDERTAAIDDLWELPRSERRDALVELVVTEFRTALRMTDDEDFATHASFFEIGFTSLLILDVKTRLETVLGTRISTNVLFNSPTVEQLVDHLAGTVLARPEKETSL